MDDLTFWRQVALREMARRVEAERRLQHDRARHKAAMAKVRRWAWRRRDWVPMKRDEVRCSCNKLHRTGCPNSKHIQHP